MHEHHDTPTLRGWTALIAARSRAIRTLRGTVLEIGAGRGENFADLRPVVDWIGLEPSARFRRSLAEKAQRHGHTAPVIAASAEAIPLDDASVDGVLATTVLCSVTDQQQVLDELTRVLVPGGSVVLVEHVAAPSGTFARRAQGVVRPLTKLFDHGCDPTRDTAQAVRHSSLQIQAITRCAIPVVGRLEMPFLVIEATKTAVRAPGE